MVTAPSPSRAEVRDQLRKVISGDLSRRDASTWAHQWVGSDRPEVNDTVVWTTLVRLGGADLPDGPDGFLYSEPDFRVWLAEVEAAGD